MKYLLILFLFSLCSCSFFNSEKAPEKYVQWLNEEDNGLIKRKYINGLVFTVKYLPAEYMAYQELKNQIYTKKDKDSLVKAYSNSLSFLISVFPDDEKQSDNGGKDVMYLGVKNGEEYAQRSLMMNFDMKEYLSLQLDDSSLYSPVLTNMENTYGISNGRNILCVFEPYKKMEEFNKSSTIDFIWDDDIFQSGRSHFIFKEEDFSSLPRLKF